MTVSARRDGETTEFPVPDDAMVAIAGPPMTGKYDLLCRLLANQCTDAIVVTTQNDADSVRRDYERAANTATAGQLGIVDCVSREGGNDSAATESTRYVNSVDDLTKIGIEFVDLANSSPWADSQRTGVGFHSLSPLLVYDDDGQIGRFVEMIGQQIRQRDWFGACVVETSTVVNDRWRSLREHFDGTIETRMDEASNAREYRVQSATFENTEWTQF